MDGQTVNLIDPAAIKQAVQQHLLPAAARAQPAAGTSPGTPASLPAGAITVDVYNGGGTPGLAGQLSQALTSAGFKAGKVGNIAAQPSTRVLYGTGAGRARRRSPGISAA